MIHFILCSNFTLGRIVEWRENQIMHKYRADSAHHTMNVRGGEVRVYTHSSVFNKLKREEILTARYLLRLWKSKIFNSSVHTQVREVKFFNSSVHTQVKEVKNF